MGCLAGIVLLVLVIPAMAQLTGRGGITGTVTDSSGAVIPGATVTATNNATKITTTTTTTGAGSYDFVNLDAGIYSVTTTAKGFERLLQENIHVNATESQAYNPVMTVGRPETEITVTGEPPQLETSNATLGLTMENETYSALPIEMGAYGSADQRRATDFVYLMPGVQGNVTNGNATTNTGVVNGSGSRGAVSDVYVDGVPFVRAGGNGDPRYVWTAISVDAVDQFQVQTTGYSAVYEGQGVMNYTIKQGGANLHGSVYEFFRNTALDSWGWFGKIPNPATGVPVKPIEHSNEYGVNLGGPLIPFGGWKQKLFFYGNYNGFRYTSATPTPMTFPTAAQQQGDFSATGIKIYDPLSQATCTAHSSNGPCRYQYGYGPGAGTGAAGNPVATGAPVNVIPSSEFSAVAVNMQSFLPALSARVCKTTTLPPMQLDSSIGPPPTASTTTSIQVTRSRLRPQLADRRVLFRWARPPQAAMLVRFLITTGKPMPRRRRSDSFRRRISSRPIFLIRSSGVTPGTTGLRSIRTSKQPMPQQRWACRDCRKDKGSRRFPS